jgi:hypothetical protein
VKQPCKWEKKLRNVDGTVGKTARKALRNRLSCRLTFRLFLLQMRNDRLTLRL